MSVSVERLSESPPEPPEEDVLQWGDGTVVYHSEDSTDAWITADESALVSLEGMR